MIEVLRPGLLTTIQDAGRRGFEAYGVPRSGVFDPFLAAVANKLVGNPLDTALIEFALVGPELRFHRNVSVAICGYGIHYEVNKTTFPVFGAFSVQAGSEFRFAGMKGWYGYIAVGGGIEGEKVLGSVSTYVAGGIGRRIQKDDRLKVGPATAQLFSLRSTHWSFAEESMLQLLPSQHTSRFNGKELQKIVEHPYRINSQSNRMGIRLEGLSVNPPSVRRSAPAIPGTVQIPRSGSPIILGPEGPTTGGYAQIAVLSRTSWTVLAATGPGKTIRFEWTDVDTALAVMATPRSTFSYGFCMATNLKPLPSSFYADSTISIAEQLIGKLLIRVTPLRRWTGRIVEVEAYIGEDDPACHAFHGLTSRTSVMYGSPGHAYVYFTYGMYFMLNVVTEREGFPAAVLIRAVEPVSGFTGEDPRPASGPGKLCRSMEIDKALNAISLQEQELFIARPSGRQQKMDVRWSSRIGITGGEDRLWRAYLFGNPHVSRKSNPKDRRQPFPL